MYIIQPKKRPAGPKGSFILGSTREFATDTLGFVLKCKKEFGDIAFAKIAFRNFYLLFKPEYFSYVLQENYKNYPKSFAYKGFKTILGNGLLTSEGEFWLKQRRLSQPAFHKERLNDLLVDMNASLKDFTSSVSSNEKLNFTSLMRKVTQDIVTRSLFGANVSVPSERLSDILDKFRIYANDKLKNPFMPPLYIPTAYNKNFIKALNELDQIVYAIIESRKQQTEVDRKNLLDLLMDARDEESGEGMSLQQLRDEIATIYVAGQETTANAICFLMYLLSQHPEEEKKVKDEIRRLGKKQDFTLQDLASLEYCRLVINESLRLYPPAWAVSRQALQDDKIGGYPIPSGSTIFLSIYALHRDENIWKNPNDFYPARFAQENFGKDQKKSFLPFGTGARICIGNNFALMEMQLIMAYLYSNFDVSIESSFIPSIKTPVTLSFKNDLPLNLKRIE